jgi:aldehyde:ferredoxin oxidoreductase
MPERFFKDAHTYGKGEGVLASHEDFDEWIEGYYADRGWDKETSRPSQEKLKELGLEFTA